MECPLPIFGAGTHLIKPINNGGSEPDALQNQRLRARCSVFAGRSTGLFEDTFGRGDNGTTAGPPQWMSGKTRTSSALDVELPGINPDEVEITAENGVLTIRGEKRIERKEGDEHSRLSRGRAVLRQLPEVVPASAGTRRVEDRSELQQRHPVDPHSKVRPPAAEEDSDQKRRNRRSRRRQSAPDELRRNAAEANASTQPSDEQTAARGLRVDSMAAPAATRRVPS